MNKKYGIWNILGRIWAVWVILIFVITMLVFMIPFLLFCYFRRDPEKDQLVHPLFPCMDGRFPPAGRLPPPGKRQGEVRQRTNLYRRL